MMSKGKYWITSPENRNSPYCVPDSDHIMIDYGCLIVFDSDNNILRAYAQGSWLTASAHVVIDEAEPNEDELW